MEEKFQQLFDLQAKTNEWLARQTTILSEQYDLQCKQIQLLEQLIEINRREIDTRCDQLAKTPASTEQLVHSTEVCQYVGIERKTLYRCENRGMIAYVKKDYTGKYYLYDDMIQFKKIYHRLFD